VILVNIVFTSLFSHWDIILLSLFRSQGRIIAIHHTLICGFIPDTTVEPSVKFKVEISHSTKDTGSFVTIQI
jgi:hypothetical protein